MHKQWQALAEQIQAATGAAFNIVATHAVGGGDINTAIHLQGQHKSYFVKLNQRHLASMFAAEFAGLQEMAALKVIRVPQPIATGQTEAQAFIVLEHIEFGGSNATSARLLGQQLALMHQAVQPFYGWHRQNTIGSTPQINTQSEDWVSFWREQRLGFQLNLAKSKGYGGRLQSTGERLCEQLAAFFDNYKPQPSLLHGDLWGGNAAYDRQGNPVIFDPACYYGDRETDLAMTELFGGFGKDFFAAYNDFSSLDAGYGTRKTLYNLYHILNHLNLFGGGYLSQAESMIARLLAELK
ncbi:MAG: fructosamine kinase family protein [Methylococcaceae bacterium]|jgi:fructosamine-3-kinase